MSKLKIAEISLILVLVALSSCEFLMPKWAENFDNPLDPENTKSISSFLFTTPLAIGVINEEAHTIAVTVPHGTDVTALVPTIIHNGSSITPSSGVAQNFSTPKVYTVVSASGISQDYTVTVTITLSSSKTISTFTFPASTSTTISEVDYVITVNVPYGTDIAALVPTITHTGASVNLDSGVAQDFTISQTYTVTAADGSTQDYSVTVLVAFNSSKAITAFTFPTSTSTTISEETHEIVITVPHGTDVTALVPTISQTGSSVTPASDVTQDFTASQTYTVTAVDGSTQAYIVTVNVSPDIVKSINSFSFAGIAGNGIIDESTHTVAITVPYGTSVLALRPTINYSGSSISPSLGLAQNFTNPVIFTVTAANGSTQAYTIIVTVALNPVKAINDFTFPTSTSTSITESSHTISVTVPYDTNVTALIPTITHTGASISPTSGVSGDFTSFQTYTVTAADGSTQSYTVTVSIALNPAKAIKAFTFPTSTSTTITEATHTILVTVPYGTNVTALVPTISHTGASVTLASGGAPNFTDSQTYIVTAADGSTQNYTVTVTISSYTSISITMVNVPAGSFQRDGTATNISTISTAFKMSQHEITRSQFAAIMGSDPSNATYSSGTNDPVQMVSWYDAIAFCNKLSIAEGLTPVYAVTGVNFATLTYAEVPIASDSTWDAATANWTANGYRLPTEMEWMWAAMGAPADGQGGGTNTTGYLKGYAGSTEGAGQTNIGNYAWYSANSSIKTHPAGTKTANELGLYDMSGNVSEWCWDQWDGVTPYPNGTLTDYMSASGQHRVTRGGYFGSSASDCTVAYRSYGSDNNY